MLVAIIMPEFMFGKALGDFVAAYRSSRCEVMQEHARKVNTEWTMTHAFYANMGGFILREGISAQNRTASDTAPAASSSVAARGEKSPLRPVARRSIPARILDHYLCHADGIWNREHNNWTNANIGFSSHSASVTSFTLPIAVNAAHLCVSITRGAIQQLPSISELEIEDKSKEDLVVKVLTLVQVTWFIIQLAVRKAKHLPCTQLEIAVLGFAVCTFITYLLWLKKPKYIRVGTDVSTTRELNADHRLRLVELNKFGFFENALHGTSEHKPTLAVPNGMINMESALCIYLRGHNSGLSLDGEDLGFIIGAVIFGACHCIAWDFEFPTVVEQTLWKAASVITIAAMPVFYFSRAFLFWILGLRLEEISYRVFGFAVYALYALCRIFIIVELFRALGYLPPESFLTTWSASLPHVN